MLKTTPSIIKLANQIFSIFEEEAIAAPPVAKAAAPPPKAPAATTTSPPSALLGYSEALNIGLILRFFLFAFSTI